MGGSGWTSRVWFGYFDVVNIEFVGIPGVGKSYLCRSIEAHLLDDRVHEGKAPLPLITPALVSPNDAWLANVGKKLARALAFSCRHPLTAVRLWRSIFGHGEEIERNRATKYINLLSELQRMHTRKATCSLLTEQGVLQAIWSLEMLALGSICETLMQLTLPWLPDAIIVVRASRTQHEKQIARRKLGKSNFDQLRGRQLSLAIDRGEDSLEKILALWSTLIPDGRRLDIDNEPERDAALLYAWLAKQL